MKTDSLDVQGTLHAQRVATLPAWAAADEGRVVYALNTHKFYVGSNTAWVELGASTPYVLPEPLIVSNFQANQSATLKNLEVLLYTTGYSGIDINEQLFEINGPTIYTLIKSYLNTPSNLKGFWWTGSTLSGSLVKDLVNGRDATFGNSGIFTGGSTTYNIEDFPYSKGMIKCVDLPHIDPLWSTMIVNDNDDFSFTTGAADVDFTIGYASYNCNTGMSKYWYNSGTFTPTIEWSIGSGGEPWFRVYSGQYDYKGRYCSTPFTYTNQWNVMIGRHTSGSLELYRNGIRIDDTNDNSGGYSRMSNTTCPVLTVPGWGGTIHHGPWAGMFIIKGESLTSTAIRTISDYILGLGRIY